MTTLHTERPVSLQSLAKRIFRRALEDLGVAHEHIAAALHRSPSKVDQWASESYDSALPVWALCSREAVSDRLFARLVADIEAVRGTTAGLTVSAEGAATSVLIRAGAAIEELARALADGRITALEARETRRRIADLESECARLRRSLDHVERSGVQ